MVESDTLTSEVVLEKYEMSERLIYERAVNIYIILLPSYSEWCIAASLKCYTCSEYSLLKETFTEIYVKGNISV